MRGPSRSFLIFAVVAWVFSGGPWTLADEPAPSTGVGHVTATIDGDEILVEGAARFVGVPVQVGTDASGDAQPSISGTDVVAATISRPDPLGGDFHFSLKVADMPAGGPTAGVDYIWCVQILPLGSDTVPAQYNHVRLHAFRKHDGALGFKAAEASSCSAIVPIPQGSGIVSADSAAITGSVAADVVTFHVPIQKVSGLRPGAIVRAYQFSNTLQSGTGQIGSSFGLFGVEWAGALDTISVSPYVVPGATVRVGVAPAGTPADQVSLTDSATVLSDSTFRASIPASGIAADSIVVAKACYGEGNCGYATTTVVT